MRPDLPYLYQQFDRFNQLCFEGKLPRAEIRLNSRRRSLGLTRYRHNRLTGQRIVWIEISVFFDMPESEYIDTLVHEMIHYYIFVNGLKDTSTHGKLFRAEMERIRRDFNLTVSISKKASESDELVAPREVRYFCLSSDSNGADLITVVAKTTIFSLWDKISGLPGLVSHKWYVSTHPDLGIYPRSRSLKFYTIDKERLAKILAESYELVRTGDIIRPKK